MSALRSRPRPWDQDGCFALDYLGGEDPREPRRALVRAVKAGSKEDVRQAARLLASALTQRHSFLSAVGRPALVAIPAHHAGRAGSTEELCAELAHLLPWLDHVPRVLQRLCDLRQSSAVTDRPSVAEHLATLRCRGGCADRSVIMVDDVLTYGRISTACAELVLDGGAASIVVACLARTQL